MGKTFKHSSGRRKRSRLAAALATVGALIMTSGFVVLATATPAAATVNCPDRYEYKDPADGGQPNSNPLEVDGDGTDDITFTWSNTSAVVTWDIADGYSVDLCVKSGDDVGPNGEKYVIRDGLTGHGSLTLRDSDGTNKSASHIEWNVQIPVPADQKPSPPTCLAAGSYSLPADTKSIDWSISPDYDGPRTYTVKAEAINDLSFANGQTELSWQVVVLPATDDCEIEIPAKPELNPPDCDSAGFFTISPTAGLTTFLDGVKVTESTLVDEAGDYTIGYIAGPGTVFEGTGKTRHTQEIEVLPATGDCGPKTVTPGVKFIDPTCADPRARYDGKNANSGVNYRIKEGEVAPGKSVVIEAVPEDGFKFSEDAETLFPYVFKAAPTNCGGGEPTPVTPVVTMVDVCGTANDSFDVVEQDDKFSYTVQGTPADGTVTITFAAKSGSTIAGPNPVVLTFTDVDCVLGTESIRPAVSFTEASCEDLDGAGFSGMFTDVVDYTVAGEVAPGEAVVVTAAIKAAAADQFSFPAGFDNTFEHTFAEFDESECVKGTQTSKPRPDEERPPTVLGTQTAVPTAVDAGLTGGPTAGGGSTTALLAQLMVGAGLLLLVAAGWTGLGGRRTRGVHEA